MEPKSEPEPEPEPQPQPEPQSEPEPEPQPVSESSDKLVSGKHVAVAKGVVRAAFELDSERVGTVKIGDVVDVLEARETDSGIVRVRFV